MSRGRIEVPPGKTFGYSVKPFTELDSLEFENFIGQPGMLANFRHSKEVEGVMRYCCLGFTKDKAHNGERQLKCKSCDSKINWKHFAADVYAFLNGGSDADDVDMENSLGMSASKRKKGTFESDDDHVRDDELGSSQIMPQSAMSSSIGLITKNVCEQVMGQVMIVMNQQLADAIGKYFETERLEKEMLRKQYADMKVMMDKMNDKLMMISQNVAEKQTVASPPLAKQLAFNDPTPVESWAVATSKGNQKVFSGNTMQSQKDTPIALNENKFATLQDFRDDMSDLSEGTLETIGQASKSEKEKTFRIAAMKMARQMNKAGRKSNGTPREPIKEFDVIFISSLTRKAYREVKVLFEGLGLDLARIKKLTWVAKSTLEVWVDKGYKAEMMGKLQSIGWNVRVAVALEKTRTEDVSDEVKHNQFQKAARHYGQLLHEARRFNRDAYYEEGLLAFIATKGELFMQTVMTKIKDIELANQQDRQGSSVNQDMMELEGLSEENQSLNANHDGNDVAELEASGRPQ